MSFIEALEIVKEANYQKIICETPTGFTVIDFDDEVESDWKVIEL